MPHENGDRHHHHERGEGLQEVASPQPRPVTELVGGQKGKKCGDAVSGKQRVPERRLG
jgi:hypothetical protein